MFETSMQVTLTDYAMKRTGKLHGENLLCFGIQGSCPLRSPRVEHEPKMWDDLKGQFVNHIPQINEDLKAAGRPPLGTPQF